MRHHSALVLGFSIHGLAVARALSKSGIKVFAITADSRLPTSYTKFAEVYCYEGVNSEKLVTILRDFAANHLDGQKAVLFPTSDNMVRSLADGWPELQEEYMLSWASCRSMVARLARKDELPDICDMVGVRHPTTINVTGVNDCVRIKDELAFPIMVKPARPLSSFKAIRVERIEELSNIVEVYKADLPFVAQQLIDGSDDTNFFCTFFLKHGDEKCAFTGQKLQSEPPITGQGTIMASVSNTRVLELGRRFCKGLDLSGPVALEFKKDPDGRYWLIEPNVGRTEYCVDLLIQAGLNLPVVEYDVTVGSETSALPKVADQDAIWFDTDKSPFCFVQYWLSSSSQRGVSTFPYYGHGDWKPLAASSWHMLLNNILRTFRWVLARLLPKSRRQS